MTQKLTLEWMDVEKGGDALVFDADTWAASDKVAQSQGKTPRQMISTAVAGCLGTMMMDSYALNRRTNNNDDPIFSGGDVLCHHGRALRPAFFSIRRPNAR